MCRDALLIDRTTPSQCLSYTRLYALPSDRRVQARLQAARLGTCVDSRAGRRAFWSLLSQERRMKMSNCLAAPIALLCSSLNLLRHNQCSAASTSLSGLSQQPRRNKSTAYCREAPILLAWYVLRTKPYKETPAWHRTSDNGTTAACRDFVHRCLC